MKLFIPQNFLKYRPIFLFQVEMEVRPFPMLRPAYTNEPFNTAQIRARKPIERGFFFLLLLKKDSSLKN